LLVSFGLKKHSVLIGLKLEFILWWANEGECYFENCAVLVRGWRRSPNADLGGFSCKTLNLTLMVRVLRLNVKLSFVILPLMAAEL